MQAPQVRCYDELAEVWPLFSPAEHDIADAADRLERPGPVPPRVPQCWNSGPEEAASRRICRGTSSSR
jgi:hypothetical protein